MHPKGVCGVLDEMDYTDLVRIAAVRTLSTEGNKNRTKKNSFQDDKWGARSAQDDKWGRPLRSADRWLSLGSDKNSSAA